MGEKRNSREQSPFHTWYKRQTDFSVCLFWVLQTYSTALSAAIGTLSVLPNMETTSHMWLWSTSGVARVTWELNYVTFHFN